MKKSLFICLSILFIGCGKKQAVDSSHPKDTTSTQKDTTSIPVTNHVDADKIEEQVMDTILSLPEMVEEANNIEKASKGKNHLAAMILETPDENGKGYYVVKVAEDNDASLVGLYNFYVYYPSFKIMFVNPIDGEETTLTDWRQSKNRDR